MLMSFKLNNRFYDLIGVLCAMRVRGSYMKGKYLKR